VANTLNLFRNGAVGFIDWLDGDLIKSVPKVKVHCRVQERQCSKPDDQKPEHVPICAAFAELTKSATNPARPKPESFPEPCFCGGVTQKEIAAAGDNEEQCAEKRCHEQRQPKMVLKLGK